MVPRNSQLTLFETYIQRKNLGDKNVSLNFPNNLHQILKNDYKRNYKKTYFDAEMETFNQNCLKTLSWHQQNRTNHILKLLANFQQN